jgi:hypothetical protein
MSQNMSTVQQPAHKTSLEENKFSPISDERLFSHDISAMAENRELKEMTFLHCKFFT